MKKFQIFSIAFLLLICLFSCKKEPVLSGGKATLHFSNDTIMFDTVFTTVGSITHHLKVYNKNDFDVKTNIIITGEDSKFYAMNVDGISGSEAKNVEIPAKDSLFIFVEVRVAFGICLLLFKYLKELQLNNNKITFNLINFQLFHNT